jgi:hypothetical protein
VDGAIVSDVLDENRIGNEETGCPVPDVLSGPNLAVTRLRKDVMDYKLGRNL